MDRQLLEKNRVCLTGLEGCGKSSGLFELLKNEVTTKSPVLFVYQTYKLMNEQINNWVTRYDVPENNFAICGHEKNPNPEIVQQFTNPKYPAIVPKDAKYVFYSQSYLQRCRHYQLSFEEISASFSRIILDEFDYTKSIIPTLDYQFSRILNNDVTKYNENQFLRWLKNNYSEADVNKIRRSKYNHDDGFLLAHWLESSQIPVMFLTSEQISAKLLSAMGFDVFHHGVTQFGDCVVNIEPADYVNDAFFKTMNVNKIWEQFDYDAIISNKIDSHYQQSTEVLERPLAVPHITAKGSNEFRNSKILTIVSHIPDKAIRIIKDVFAYFGMSYSFNEVKALYYKAILLQAIGRVIGYRGSKETDVIVHSSIWNVIKDNVELPYNFNDKWRLNFENKVDIIKHVEMVKAENKRKKNIGQKSIISFGLLRKYFVESPDHLLTVPEIKDYLKQHRILNKGNTGPLAVSKLATYFNKEFVYRKINNKTVRCLSGLDFVKEFTK